MRDYARSLGSSFICAMEVRFICTMEASNCERLCYVAVVRWYGCAACLVFAVSQ